MLFEVFAHSFFNGEDEMSAAEMIAMFHFYFLGNPEGLLFDAPHRLRDVYLGPVRALLKRRGSTFVSTRAVPSIGERSGA